MGRDAFRESLAAALAQDRPYGERRIFSGGRPAAVLLLIGFGRDHGREPELLITRRTDSVGSHKGQMAFPGGVCDPHETGEGSDGVPPGAVLAALRETHEEVGIPPSAIDVIGRLPELSTITDFRIAPSVGLLRDSIEEYPLRPNPDEIAQAFWIRLSTLLEPGVYRTEFVQVGEERYPIHVYQVGEHRIWGATAAMIKNLLDRLRALG